MVDVSDLWVGDILRLKSSGREGKFLGMAGDERLRVFSGGKVVLVRARNVEKVAELEPNEKLKQLKAEALEVKLGVNKVESTIDLHIDKLNPNLENALPERIVDFQIKAFENYYARAVKQGLKFVTIIHGRGTGVLRRHIHSFLGVSSEVRSFHLVHNDGATEVIYK